MASASLAVPVASSLAPHPWLYACATQPHTHTYTLCAWGHWARGRLCMGMLSEGVRTCSAYMRQTYMQPEQSESSACGRPVCAPHVFHHTSQTNQDQSHQSVAHDSDAHFNFSSGSSMPQCGSLLAAYVAGQGLVTCAGTGRDAMGLDGLHGGAQLGLGLAQSGSAKRICGFGMIGMMQRLDCLKALLGLRFGAQ